MFADGKLPIAYSTNSQFTKKMQLPMSRAVRKAIARLSADVNREWVNGGQPVSGMFTLVGKADQLPRGHKFRQTVANMLRRRIANNRG